MGEFCEFLVIDDDGFWLSVRAVEERKCRLTDIDFCVFTVLIIILDLLLLYLLLFTFNCLF